ncbi:GTP pyrophosphokinase [Mycolicibacterium vaccae]|uniref:RelA/SpoT domain-containing protein n=1 Tax=Mycolicibacterium vaccae ATCC 25954 TaxID=1194972 RepID=K0V432_MYCVA|nr:RelA/SpoT domain-containing protein [Mycolicibacterium vaccae]EJZ12210.1 RelA/SpoT domain-containing protein [Mycolicibacterium vaccae ATCC 25954]MCV7060832.1 hypothetical protein [Mycolicibacterium vaccae]
MSAEQADYDFDRWLAAFDGNIEVFVRLREEVQYAVESAIKASGIKAHTVVSRVKSRESYREKLERKQYADPMQQMHDIVGARIVCLFPDDVEKIGAILGDTFEVLHFDDKGKGISPEIWRYVSVHYDCKIKNIHQGPRYDDIKDSVFEVQVRTILQDAWANVEHYLAYKGASSIPASLRRDFSALVGLFHVADKSFQQIYDQSQALDDQASQEMLATHRPPANDAHDKIDIDRSTVKALCKQLYPDRRQSPDSAYSDFVEDLATVNLRDLDGLQELITDGRKEAEEREATYLANHQGFQPLTDIGIARLAVSVVVPEFKQLQRERRIRPTAYE